jgi:hypothetical protein
MFGRATRKHVATKPVAVDQPGRGLAHGLKPLQPEGQRRRHLLAGRPLVLCLLRDQQPGFQERQPGGHHQIIGRQFQADAASTLDEGDILLGKCQHRNAREIDALVAGEMQAEGRADLRKPAMSTTSSSSCRPRSEGSSCHSGIHRRPRRRFLLHVAGVAHDCLAPEISPCLLYEMASMPLNSSRSAASSDLSGLVKPASTAFTRRSLSPAITGTTRDYLMHFIHDAMAMQHQIEPGGNDAACALPRYRRQAHSSTRRPTSAGRRSRYGRG